VQGCLRNESLTATIRTRCASTGRDLTLDVDGLGRVRVAQEEAAPLLFEPHVDWVRFRKPHIIDDF